jgi:hypothetical protein
MMTPHAAALERDLGRLRKLRGEGGSVPVRLHEVKGFQSARLRATYADIAELPRYRAATAFFLDDLYGPKDFSGRDAAMMRIVPVMSRVLPDSAVETAALAIELEALSESLDQRLATALPEGPIGGVGYAAAYRKSSTPAEREHQIALIEAVGERLDALVKKPFVYGTLKLMRKPAHMAGLTDLQDFLERGFASFREMHGADQFMALIGERERAILSDLFSGKPLVFPA